MDLSFCIIGKNESSHLRRCLTALKKCGHEIVFVDTGSSDETVAIAREYTDKVFFFEWINDFSAARNFAMEQASEDMVFFVDCDEYLEDVSSCIEAITLMEAYPDALGQILRRNLCDDSNGGQTVYEDLVERFFDRRLYKYTGRIHEQPVRRDGSVPSACRLPMIFSHDGYLGTPEQKKKKGLRDQELLLRDLEENRKNNIPDDPYIFYQLGQASTLMADKEKALEYYKSGVALDIDPSLTYVQMMITNYGNTLTDAQRCEEALALARYEDRIDDYADYFTMLGFAALQEKKYLTAIYYYKKALGASGHNLIFAAGALPHHNLGCIYEAFGNYKKAIEHFEAADKAGHEGSAARASALRNKQENTSDKDNGIFHNFIFICDEATDLTRLKASMDSLRAQTVGFEHVMATFVCRADSKSDPLYTQIRAWENESPDNILVLESDIVDKNTARAEILYTVLQYSSAPLITIAEPGEMIHIDHVRTVRSFSDLLISHSPAVIRCGYVKNIKELYIEPAKEKEPQAWQIPGEEFSRIITSASAGCSFSADSLSGDKTGGYVLADIGLNLIMA